jgi:Rieske Fe-S protein
MTENHSPGQHADDPTPSQERRLFFKIFAGAVGAVAGLIPVVAGLWTFLDPATRRERRFADAKKPKGLKTDDGFIRVASLAEVPQDGRPLRVQVRDDVTNKWTYSPNEPVGEVFLIRKGSGTELTVFTTVCPHLGCSISLASNGAGKQVFKCPCHNSSFELDGACILPTPSPRSMDLLPARVDDGYVYVKYQNYYTGRPKAEVKS